MTHSNPINEELSALLKAREFRKKSNTWYLDRDESKLVVNLQKSQYGDQFYINFAVALKALDPPEFPKEYQCHVRVRLEATIPEAEREPCKAALNFENVAVTPDDRMAAIRRLVEMYGLPLLNDCASLAGIATAIANGRLKGAMVNKQVKDLLAQGPKRIEPG